MINLNGNIDNVEGEKVLEQLQLEKDGLPDKRKRYASMGIYLPLTTDHLDKECLSLSLSTFKT